MRVTTKYKLIPSTEGEPILVFRRKVGDDPAEDHILRWRPNTFTGALKQAAFDTGFYKWLTWSPWTKAYSDGNYFGRKGQRRVKWERVCPHPNYMTAAKRKKFEEDWKAFDKRACCLLRKAGAKSCRVNYFLGDILAHITEEEK